MIHDDNEEDYENDGWQPLFGKNPPQELLGKKHQMPMAASIPIALYCWLYMHIENIKYTCNNV
jgi:hypothetical protein